MSGRITGFFGRKTPEAPLKKLQSDEVTQSDNHYSIRLYTYPQWLQ